MIDKLERKYGRFAISNLTLKLVTGQIITWVLATQRPQFVERLLLTRDGVLAGEVWRLFTFVITPEVQNPLFFIIFIYIFFFLGTELESLWGAFKFNVYVLSGSFLTIVTVMLFDGVGTSHYVEITIFLAFARLYPDYEFLLFFILPIKIKYLALFTWILIGFQLVAPALPLSQKAVILAAVSNFFFFFGREILQGVKAKKRTSAFTEKAVKVQRESLHCCAVCNKTEHDDRNLIFRVCSACLDGSEYCEDHLKTHEHRVAEVDDHELNDS
ncbi:hypothetical protein JYT61_00880 [bacterium AH-315-E10]|nr:hypothetical protein [bacterium AH-315-E10]